MIQKLCTDPRFGNIQRFGDENSPILTVSLCLLGLFVESFRTPPHSQHTFLSAELHIYLQSSLTMMGSAFIPGGSIQVARNGPLQIISNPAGRNFLDWSSGQSFHVSTIGERKSIADGLLCYPGEEFTSYVRRHLSPFPYDWRGPAHREIRNLWPGRVLQLKLHDYNWINASVVSFSEDLSGPFAHCTNWCIRMKIHDRPNEIRLGDLVKPLGGPLHGKTGTIVSFREDRTCEIFCQTYQDGRCVSQQVRYSLTELKPEKDLELFIESANVEQGGILSGDSELGMQDTVEFTWIDPPSPELSHECFQESCYHGSSEVNFKGALQQAVQDFLNRKRDVWDKKSVQLPEFISPDVKMFVEENSDLVTEEFCNHVFANCAQMYVEKSKEQFVYEDALMKRMRHLLGLAICLRYGYLLQEKSEWNFKKIVKYGQNIHTERGLARVLSKEVKCPCAKVLANYAEDVVKDGVCFNCQEIIEKISLHGCSSCRFARYCSRDCQVADW